MADKIIKRSQSSKEYKESQKNQNISSEQEQVNTPKELTKEEEKILSHAKQNWQECHPNYKDDAWQYYQEKIKEIYD